MQGEYKFNIHYKVIPVLHSDVNINVNPFYNNIKVEKLTSNIKSYYDIEGINNKLSSNKYDITINKNNIKFENKDEIKRGNDIDLELNINTSLFSRKIPFAIILAVVWSAVVFIISILLIVLVGSKSNIIENITNRNNSEVIKVEKFVEKPNKEKAEERIRESECKLAWLETIKTKVESILEI